MINFFKKSASDIWQAQTQIANLKLKDNNPHYFHYHKSTLVEKFFLFKDV